MYEFEVACYDSYEHIKRNHFYIEVICNTGLIVKMNNRVKVTCVKKYLSNVMMFSVPDCGHSRWFHLYIVVNPICPKWADRPKKYY